MVSHNRMALALEQHRINSKITSNLPPMESTSHPHKFPPEAHQLSIWKNRVKKRFVIILNYLYLSYFVSYDHLKRYETYFSNQQLFIQDEGIAQRSVDFFKSSLAIADV